MSDFDIVQARMNGRSLAGRHPPQICARQKIAARNREIRSACAALASIYHKFPAAITSRCFMQFISLIIKIRATVHYCSGARASERAVRPDDLAREINRRDCQTTLTLLAGTAGGMRAVLAGFLMDSRGFYARSAQGKPPACVTSLASRVSRVGIEG